MSHTLHRWQRECIDLLAKRVRRPEKTGMVQAFTGSGKSVVQSYLSQMLVSTLRSDEVTIFATSRQVLVEQFVKKDLTTKVPSNQIGQFYGRGKRFLGKRIIVTTYASMLKCAAAIEENGGKIGALVVDEAHNTGAEALDDWMCERREMGLRRIYGFTATAFRGNVKESIHWAEELIYCYPYADALKDGVIVPYQLRTRAGEICDTDDGIIDMIEATDALRYGAMLVTAADIADAERFAARLSDRGIIARHVASDTGREVIPEVEEGFATGALLAITSPRLVSEGYDYPPLKVVVFRAPLSKEGGRVLAIQTVGRALRVVRPGIRTKDRPKGFDREIARWGEMGEALILDPRNSFAQIGLQHDPAIGFRELEPEAPSKAKSEPSEGGLLIRPPDLLGDVPPPIAWALALMAWTEQGAAVCPLALSRRPSFVTDRTPSGVTNGQGRYAAEYRAVLRRAVKIEEPHRSMLFDGLSLVEAWAGSPDGLGRWRQAAAVLHAADTLIGHFKSPLFSGAKPLIIPQHVIPHISMSPSDSARDR